MIAPANFPNTEKRIEIKEVFRPSDLVKLHQAILLSRFSFRTHYPKRKINSIYYDTHNYRSLEDSIEGGSCRTKYRIRWYGNTQGISNATLEIKKKEGHLSWKLLKKNSFRIYQSAKTWETFLSPNSNSRSSNLFLLNQQPKSIITYDREYYVSFNGKVRLTIDQNLRSFNQENSTKPNLHYYRPHIAFVIFEIKVSRENESLVKHVLRDLPFSAKRFSKYCESIIPQQYL
jgi:hypothetical protein